MTSLNEVAELENLRSAWTQVRENMSGINFRDSGVHDPLEWADFELFLVHNLRRISDAVRDGSYSPETPIFIEKARSRGMTRPISVVTIDDAVVFQGLVIQIAPLTQDDRWSGAFDMVPTGDRDRPFEAWYEQWPEYQERLRDLIERGYSCLGITDISSYFEYINHELLVRRLYDIDGLPSDVADFTLYLLEHWTYRPDYAPNRYCGLPQMDHDGPRFLANHFLNEHDERIGDQCDEYVRWMDDMNLPAHSRAEAREYIQEVDRSLRSEYLSINRGKTTILEGAAEIADYFWFDYNEFFDEFAAEVREQDPTRDNLIQLEAQLQEVFERYRQECEEGRGGHSNKILRRFFTMFKRVDSSHLLEETPIYLRRSPGLEHKLFDYLHGITWRSEIGHVLDEFLHSDDNIYQSVEISALRTLLHHRITDEDDRLRVLEIGGEWFFGRNDVSPLSWYSRVLGAFLIGKYGTRTDLRGVLAHVGRAYGRFEQPYARRQLAYLSLQLHPEYGDIHPFPSRSRRDPHRLVQSVWQMTNSLRSDEFTTLPDALRRKLNCREIHYPSHRAYYPWTRMPLLNLLAGITEFREQLHPLVVELRDESEDQVTDQHLRFVEQRIA